MSHSDVIRATSLSQSQDHVPDLVVSPASPNRTTPSGKDKTEFTFETVVSSSPPLRRGKTSQNAGLKRFLSSSFTQVPEVVTDW